MLNSPRTAGVGGLPGDSSWQTFMNQYVNNWSQVQAALAAGNVSEFDAALAAAAASAAGGPVPSPDEAATTTERVRRGGGGGGRRDTGFVGGGYAQPSQVNQSMGGWGNVLNALGGAAGGGVDVDRAARKAVRQAERNGGTYVEEPKDRTRERSRTRTSKDGTTTTSTNVNISRNGGTAIAVDSGSDGNRQRKKKKNSEMVY